MIFENWAGCLPACLSQAGTLESTNLTQISKLTLRVLNVHKKTSVNQCSFICFIIWCNNDKLFAFVGYLKIWRAAYPLAQDKQAAEWRHVGRWLIGWAGGQAAC